MQTLRLVARDKSCNAIGAGQCVWVLEYRYSKKLLLTVIFSGVLTLVLNGCWNDNLVSPNLHMAAQDNTLDVATLLIDRGANTEGIDLGWMN